MRSRGSAMVWAVVSLLIACVVAVSILSLGKSVATRSVDENAARQAYLTARSAVDAVVSQIENCTASGSSASVPDFASVLIPDDVGSTVTVNNFSFPDGMGDCTVTVERTEASVLTVEATAQVGGVESTVKATMTSGYVSGSSPEALVDGMLGGLYTNTLSFQSNSDLRLIGTAALRTTAVTGTTGSTITVGGTLYTSLSVSGGSIGGVSVTYGSLMGIGSASGTLIDSYTLPLPAVALSDNSGSFTLLSPSGGVGCYVLTNGASSLASSGTPDSDGVIQQNSIITVSGSSSYLIKVTPGCTLNLSLQKTGSGTPKVYIFLDGKSGSTISTLNLYSIASGINVYVCGGSGSAVLIRNALSMTGYITADVFTLHKNCTLTYAGSDLQSALATSGSTTVTYYWSFERYD